MSTCASLMFFFADAKSQPFLPTLCAAVMRIHSPRALFHVNRTGDLCSNIPFAVGFVHIIPLHIALIIFYSPLLVCNITHLWFIFRNPYQFNKQKKRIKCKN